MVKAKKDNEVVDKAYDLIRKTLGSYTAELYKDFYTDKGSDIIVRSVRELLIEAVGKENAKEKMIRAGLLVNK